MKSKLAVKADVGDGRAELSAECAALRREIAVGCAALRTEIAVGCAALRREMATEFQRSEDRLLLRLGGLIVTCTTVIISILQIG